MAKSDVLTPDQEFELLLSLTTYCICCGANTPGGDAGSGEEFSRFHPGEDLWPLPRSPKDIQDDGLLVCLWRYNEWCKEIHAKERATWSIEGIVSKIKDVLNGQV